MRDTSPSLSPPDEPQGPFDTVSWNDGEIRIEIEGYHWGSTVALSVWDGRDPISDVPLDAVDLRHLARWALAVADAMDNPPDVSDALGKTSRVTKMPQSGVQKLRAAGRPA